MAKTFIQGDMRAPLFGLHLQGGGVSKQGIEIGFLARFLDEFRKFFAPLQVVSTGEIPQGNRLPAINAGPLEVSALASTASATIFFGVDPSEGDLMTARRDVFGLVTVQAVGHLGALLGLDPDHEDVRTAVEPFGRRVGRSYGGLADLLAQAKVEADWYSDLYTATEIEVPATRSARIADELLHKAITESTQRTIGGFMWAATTASKQRTVRIQSDDAAIRAKYDIPLTGAVTEALSHVVKARLLETTYRFPFAEQPHRREWELLEILEVGPPAGALAGRRPGDARCVVRCAMRRGVTPRARRHP